MVLFAVVVIGLARLTPKLLPILLAAFLALVFGLVLDAPVRALAARGVRRGMGTTLVAVVAAGLVVGLGLLIGPTVAHELASLSSQHHSLSAAIAHRLNGLSAHLPVKLPHLRASELGGKQILHAIGGSATLASAGETIGLVAIAFLAAAWGVSAPDPLARRLLSLVPEARRGEVARVSGAVLANLRRWLVGQLIVNVVVGATTYVLLVVLGVPFAALFAVMAAVLGMIPTFGLLASSAGPVLLTLLYHPGRVVPLLIAIAVLHLLIDRFLVPVVMQRTLDLHQSLLTFILLIASVVLGPLGLVLAVPISATLLTIHDEVRAAGARVTAATDAAADGRGTATGPGGSERPSAPDPLPPGPR